ncbi:MAG: PocR ligand-binding domain-containing protein [Planctomycetes bacterium]|nr:PocR ligand-binding domain-containing protein [Planctomycetota bacterium]
MLQTTQPEFVLTDFIDAESLHNLLDGFARVTGVSTSLRDASGNPITAASQKPAFCRLMQSTPSGAAACLASHAAASEAARVMEAPSRTCCHAGLSHSPRRSCCRDVTLAPSCWVICRSRRSMWIRSNRSPAPTASRPPNSIEPPPNCSSGPMDPCSRRCSSFSSSPRF